MKALLAQFIFETNTFNPAPVELDAFQVGGTWLTDEGAIRTWCRTADSQLAGSLEVLDGAGWETHPVFVANCGTPAGRLSRTCFAAIAQALIDGLHAAGPTDVVVLHLHGAACAEGEDDTEGALLERVRRELGFKGWLVVSLDLHANVTRRMVAHADAFTAYRTMPHVDFRDTGRRAAQLALLGQRRTRRLLVKMRALLPPTDTTDTGGRFATILGEARKLERLDGVLDVSVFPVQPWMDVAEMGSSVLVTHDHGVDPSAEALALVRQWYEQRAEWRTGLQSWDRIFSVLDQRAGHPWILVDSADATTAGSAGASSEVLRRLWPRRASLPGEVLLWVVDRKACAAFRSGVKSVPVGEPPFPVTGEVIFRGEGRYRARGRAYTGQEFSIGEAVVIANGRLRVVVSSAGALGADPALYECVGLDPSHAHAVQAKSLMGWRAGYEVPAEWGLMFDGPGAASLDFARLPFTGERRDLFPIHPAPPNPPSLWPSI